jgi:hypothetical protein
VLLDDLLEHGRPEPADLGVDNRLGRARRAARTNSMSSACFRPRVELEVRDSVGDGVPHQIGHVRRSS